MTEEPPPLVGVVCAICGRTVPFERSTFIRRTDTGQLVDVCDICVEQADEPPEGED